MEIDSLYPDILLYHNAPKTHGIYTETSFLDDCCVVGEQQKNTGPATALEHKHFFIFINQIGHDKRPEHTVLSP